MNDFEIRLLNRNKILASSSFITNKQKTRKSIDLDLGNVAIELEKIKSCLLMFPRYFNYINGLRRLHDIRF